MRAILIKNIILKLLFIARLRPSAPVRLCGLFFLLLSIHTLHSQSILSLEQAAKIAMSNNYDILIAATDSDIARANNTWGNAGALPTISATITDNFALNNYRQEQASGVLYSKDNTPFNSFSAGAFINWTVYDGGKMFITKRKLNQLQSLGVIQFRDQVMATLYDVIAAYYDVVRQKQQLVAALEAIKYNTERVKIYQTRFDAGLSAKNDLLQAQVDLNGFKQNVITQQVAIINAKRKLNQLLSRESETAFEVPDSIVNSYRINKADLLKKAQSSNTTILNYLKQIDISKLAVKEFQSLYYPRVSLTAGYNAARNDNRAGFTNYTQSLGPQLGAGITVPIYQGGNVKRQIAVAKIQMKASEIALQRAELQVKTALLNAITDYENQQLLYDLEKESAGLSKESLDIAQARLRLGQSNSLELRQAELSYQTSLTKLSNIQYALKIAEIKLKQLVAEL